MLMVLKEQREIVAAVRRYCSFGLERHQEDVHMVSSSRDSSVARPRLIWFSEAEQDFQYGGYTYLKGWKILRASDRSHHDPKYIPDPSRFEGSGPPPYADIPFGWGSRMCLVKEFTRTEMLVFLHHIVLNFEWKMVDPYEPICIDPIPTFNKGLQLKIQKKDNTS